MKLKLSQEDIALIEKETPQTSSTLSAPDITKIATKINSKIQLPFLKEEKEQMIFELIVKFLDKKIHEKLGPEYYAMIKSLEGGLNDSEIASLKAKYVPLINEKVNIPFIKEKKEGKIMSDFVDYIVDTIKDKV